MGRKPTVRLVLVSLFLLLILVLLFWWIRSLAVGGGQVSGQDTGHNIRLTSRLYSLVELQGI